MFVMCHCQPSLFVDTAGDVRMLARTTSRHVAMAVSKNNGKDWCAPCRPRVAFQPRPFRVRAEAKVAFTRINEEPHV